MTQKVNAQDIQIGMFVADLDRPWIDTPFLLQGFLVEDAEQVRQLREHCQWVLIDPHRSVGPGFDTPVRKPGTPASQQSRDARPAGTNMAGSNAAPVAPRTPAPNPVQSRTPAAAPKPPPPATPGKPPLVVSGPRSPAAVPGPRRLEAAAPPRRASDARDSDSADHQNRGGLWGKLRSGLAGLFSKQAEDEYDDAGVPEYAPEKPEFVRASFIPEGIPLKPYEDKRPVEEEIGAATVAFQRTNELMYRMVEDIRAGNTLQLESVEEVINDMVDSMVRNPDALMWVARMREQHLTVYDHGLSVAVSLVAFGRHLGYPKEQLSQLGTMGLLLDIGKIKLPKELLEKNARLSSDEFEQIKEHVDLGLEVLMQTPNMHPDVIEGIAQHHERMNGTGYPNNVMGDKLSIFGRMAAIADTYAAVTKHRPYAEAVSPHEALQMLSNWSGTQFHAEMVEQFIQSNGVFPVGSLVELSTGEIAVVVTHSKLKRLRPKVLVVADADKSHCKHPAMRDLLYDVSDSPAYIRRGLPSNAYGLDPSEYYLA